MKNKIPKLGKLTLSHLVTSSHPESVLADYEELYFEIEKSKNRFNANLWLTFQIIVLFPSYFRASIYWSLVMFKNYFIIALRNLRRQKIYSFINISGLAIGMASIILIGAYILDELNYDQYHKNKNRIYRVTKSKDKTTLPDWIGTQAPLATSLRNKFPEIENYVRIDPFIFKNKTLISYEDKSFYEDRFILADPSLFKVFDFKLINGNSESVLKSPQDVVITESIAKKYFGEENPIGKTLSYESQNNLTITGVIEDIPANSHFSFDFVASFEFINEYYQSDLLNNWGKSNFFTYFLLRNGVNLEDFTQKSSGYLAEITNQRYKSLYFQTITDIHLRSKVAKDPMHRGDMMNIYLYSALAVVILLIACINFMNLYTANSEIRAKEVGMRKVLGAQKKQLISQFIGEAVVFSALALPISIILVDLILPQFNLLTGKQLDINYTGNLLVIGILFFMIFTVGLLAGSYPAFFVSSFQPTKIFQGNLQSGKKGLKFRNVLVTFQFVVSIIFITGSFIIKDQMHFVRTKKLGYEKENIVNISIYDSQTRGTYPTLKNELLNHSNVINVTASSYTPSIERWREGMHFEGRTPEDNHMFYRMAADYNLPELFNMNILEGRTFDEKFLSDLINSYILNESAVKSIGWTNQEAIGKIFGGTNGKVIGVVEDFNFRSLRLPTMPMVINVFPRFFNYISVKIKPGDIPNTIQFLSEKWKTINPGIPFEYYFYDDEFNKLYKADTNLETVFEFFTFLAIFIACLGLFGLSLFTVRQKTKEIGIRKVLGASVAMIVYQLSKELTKWVLLANLIAWPLAWLIMNKWLQGFSYRTNLGLELFLYAAIIALVIAFITVSFQAIRAALANPINSLKYE